MGIASLVLGIIGLLFSIIPIIGLFGGALAIVGLILGIVDWVQKKKNDEKYGQAVAGVICSAIAIVIIIMYTVLAGALFVHIVDNVDEGSVQNFMNSVQKLEESNDINFSFDGFNVNDITNL